MLKTVLNQPLSVEKVFVLSVLWTVFSVENMVFYINPTLNQHYIQLFNIRILLYFISESCFFIKKKVITVVADNVIIAVTDLLNLSLLTLFLIGKSSKNM